METLAQTICNQSHRLDASRRDIMLSAAAFLLGAANPVWAQPVRQIREILFPSTSNLLSWSADASGAYRQFGLSLETGETGRSVDLIRALMSGERNLAASTFDNVVAYNEGQGDPSLRESADLICVMGLADSISVPLIGDRRLRSVQDLRGRKIAVDAPTTGFAFLSRALLQKAGLSSGDYELVRIGAARQRLDALRKGDVDAALLTSPFDSLAYKDGFVRLTESGRLYRRFQSNCIITTRRWANANRQLLVDALTAKLRAFQWISSDANLAAASDILRSHNADLDEAGAKAAVLDLRRSFQPKVSFSALAPVLELRARYAEPHRALQAPQAYVDLSFYGQAVRQLARS